MVREQLHQVYAEQMSHHSLGHALYQPVSNTTLKPGACGYFDNTGQWQPIAQLDDALSLRRMGLKRPAEPLRKAPTMVHTEWGPKASGSVGQRNAGASIGSGGLVTAVPVSGAVTLEYSSASEFGAILVTENPVQREAFLYESPFARWARDNIDVLLQSARGQEIQKYGLTIATQTFTTRRCSITCWTDRSKSIHLAVKVNAAGVLDFGPEGGWTNTSHDEGWTNYNGNDNERIVVFVSGLTFRIKRLLGFIGAFEQPLHYRGDSVGSLESTQTEEDRVGSMQESQLEYGVLGNSQHALVSDLS